MMTDDRSDQSRRFYVLFAAIAVVVASILCVYLTRHSSLSPPQPNTDLSVWQTRFTTKRELNSKNGDFTSDGSITGYVGAQACRDCHLQKYESYIQTLHSKSFKDTLASDEPASGTLFHAESNRRYEAYRDGDSLRHREELIGADGQKIAITDIAMKYTVGSGEHAHTYLYESDGFLFESPITWFREADGWKMSPGYDIPGHSSFARVIPEDCAFCHVGMIDRSANNYAKFRVVEQNIGCERCHGPGQLHVEIQNREIQPLPGVKIGNQSPADSGQADPIVHPAKLTREKSESICQQCHLQGAAFATATQTSRWDFRPGMSILNIRSDYQIAGSSESKIVGHVEQMHQSACYLGSDTLTCITCHNPHHNVPKQDRTAYYRDTCLKCHGNEDCGVTQTDRNDSNGNDCAACHMPKVPTNVSHASLHHHRIGIHESAGHESSSDLEQTTMRLVSILNDQTLDDEERLRRELLALREYSRRPGVGERIEPQIREVMRKLIASLRADSMNPDIRLMFAIEANGAGEFQIAIDLASQVLLASRAGSTSAIDSRVLLSTIAYRAGNRDVALPHYRELAKQRVDAEHFYFLGLCELFAGNVDNAVSAIETSLLLKPDDIDAHQVLADIFNVAQRDRARQHRLVIQALEAMRRKTSGNDTID